ncbi:tetratricopeptide repeat protein [Candidatus Poribacteria bacterium]|nr:tetratricopeptide repeat protein [Candidatus Poribacteria bacterium]MYI93933.1 tetratricopeptide repeat protein [Candidatus Poribacteria bacterium]
MVKPWHDKANADFTTLVDSQNILGNTYNLKAIPYGVMIDEAGRLTKQPFSINVAKKETIKMLETWLSDPTYNTILLRDIKPLKKSKNPKVIEANARFQLGLTLLKIGKKQEAMIEWRKALQLDPKNWLIHKQIWAVEHPDKFYDGNVDYGWQKEQLETEKNE